MLKDDWMFEESYLIIFWKYSFAQVFQRIVHWINQCDEWDRCLCSLNTKFWNSFITKHIHTHVFMATFCIQQALFTFITNLFPDCSAPCWWTGLPRLISFFIQHKNLFQWDQQHIKCCHSPVYLPSWDIWGSHHYGKYLSGSQCCK